MNYAKLVETIVDKLLSERLEAGEVPSDRGSEDRNIIASEIRSARKSANPAEELAFLRDRSFEDAREAANHPHYDDEDVDSAIIAGLHFDDAHLNRLSKAAKFGK